MEHTSRGATFFCKSQNDRFLLVGKSWRGHLRSFFRVTKIALEIDLSIFCTSEDVRLKAETLQKMIELVARQSGRAWSPSGNKNATYDYFQLAIVLICTHIAFLLPERLHTRPLCLEINSIVFFKVLAFKRTYSGVQKMIRSISNAIVVPPRKFQKSRFFGHAGADMVI